MEETGGVLPGVCEGPAGLFTPKVGIFFLHGVRRDVPVAPGALFWREPFSFGSREPIQELGVGEARLDDRGEIRGTQKKPYPAIVDVCAVFGGCRFCAFSSSS